MNSPIDTRHSENLALPRLRRFFSCNPLYFASAGLLLYGINRLSTDAGIAGNERSQITFNFAALFIYEILLVTTAIALARRRIWYDSLLLVALENLFVLVPFSLVSRAVQLNESLGQTLCGAAVLLAVAKFWAMRRYIPGLNLPPRLLAFGAIIMAANVALALGLRRIYDDPHALKSWLTNAWLFGMPALVALANFLPSVESAGRSPEQRSWLPRAALGIWIAVTACHLGGVGYVFTFDWSPALLAPGLWMLAWTLLLNGRTHKSALAQGRLCVLPVLATLLATKSPHLFVLLNLLNAIGFAVMWWRSRARFIIELSAVSLAMCIAGIPVEWRYALAPRLDGVEWGLSWLGMTALGFISVSRNPKWAIVGGGLSTIVAAMIAHRAAGSGQWAIHAGVVYVLAHSLRWRDSEIPGARVTRIALCGIWIASALLWTFTNERESLFGCYVFGGIMLALYAVRRMVARDWSPWPIPIHRRIGDSNPTGPERRRLARLRLTRLSRGRCEFRVVRIGHRCSIDQTPVANLEMTRVETRALDFSLPLNRGGFDSGRDAKPNPRCARCADGGTGVKTRKGNRAGGRWFQNW